MWNSGTRTVNPAAGTVLVDSGQIPNDQAMSACYIIMTSTVACFFVVERRNAANTATVTDQAVACQANSTCTLNFQIPIDFLQNERLRVIINGAVTGTVQASMFWQ